MKYLLWPVFYFLVLSCIATNRSTYIEPVETELFTNLLQNLKGKSVLMIGDSLMRYHYLAMAYLLRHHHPVSKTLMPSIIQQSTWPDFQDFLIGSKSLLFPYEQCDCFRNNPRDQLNITENRYYNNPTHNINISFLLYFGEYCHGQWWPGQSTLSTDLAIRTTDHYLPDRWKLTLEETISAFNNGREHATSILILNVGFWHQEGKTGHLNQKYRYYVNESIVEAATKNFKHVIWKTSNYISGGFEFQPSCDPIDQFWCSRQGVHCLNLSWTKDLNVDDYWDKVHFKANIYNRIISQLNELLQKIGV